MYLNLKVFLKLKTSTDTQISTFSDSLIKTHIPQYALWVFPKYRHTYTSLCIKGISQIETHIPHYALSVFPKYIHTYTSLCIMDVSPI